MIFLHFLSPENEKSSSNVRYYHIISNVNFSTELQNEFSDRWVVQAQADLTVI